MHILWVVVLAVTWGYVYPQGLLEGVVNLLMNGQQQVVSEIRDEPTLLPQYDFIIVGAGTAGCVLANRLSENPQWTVLLIEAGDQENYFMDFPLLANYLQFTASNWKYRTMPSDRYCTGMYNNKCNWPRGKVMGGSSVLNYMIYTRGNRRDYDHWSSLGNPGWSFEEVLPYFKKIENFKIPKYVGDKEYHSTEGPLSITYAQYHTKLAESLVAANQEMGLNYTDYNSKTQIGVSYLQASLKDGLRHSSNRAYLNPIRNRKNLHVKKLSQVTKVLINPQTKRAYGVEFIRDSTAYQITCSKEVILTAGALNSPQLLMLSGVGPKKHLQELNITVHSNLKVGYNLMDHIGVGGLTFTINKPYSINVNKALQSNNLREYLNFQKGPITIPGGCELLTFYDLKDPTNPDGYPDMELLYNAGSIASEPLLRKDFGMREEIYNSVFRAIENVESFMIIPMLLRPKSKGRVFLRNSKPMSKPMLYPNYFHDEDDLKTLVKGVRLAINVTSQPAMLKIGAKLYDVPIPECAHFEFASDEYFECQARLLTLTIYHQSGTCKMGPESDRMAVVDARLKVYRIGGLRVADASIMPEIVAAHTNAPVYMIAEKAADMIKEDWRV